MHVRSAEPRIRALASSTVLRFLLSVVGLCAASSARPAAAEVQPHAEARGVASIVLDLNSGRPLETERPDIIERPILPGSVMKIVALAAAMESGIIDEHTRIACTRTVVVDGHRLTCTHPDFHRPLTPVEALAHSCNSYVATVAARIPRASFDQTLLALGLPRSAPGASVQVSAFGVAGTRMTPRALITAVARIGSATTPLPWNPTTLRLIREGLHAAATTGTASALGASGVDALAKTGTVGAGTVSRGLVVGVTPSVNPTRGFAVMLSGGAGSDAAGLVADRLRRVSAAATQTQPHERRDATQHDTDATTIRVGIARRDGRYEVKTLSLDDYVAGVVAGEMVAGSSPAAIDALAIAVRTYALANRGRHAAEGFDLCDLTHCQVFRSPGPASSASAARTSGRYLADKGRPANVFYTASCGGHSERPSAVWRGASDPTFLPSRVDAACASQPAWSSEISAGDLVRALQAGGFAGATIRGVGVTARTDSGRAAWLRIDGITPADISGENLRTLVGRTLGWQLLRSTLFDVTRTARGFRFSGRGAGHGVGLCVLGAVGRAKQGASVDTILNEYYPGLTVARQPSPSSPGDDVRIVLPQQDERRRSEVRAAVNDALRRVSAALDATIPSGVVVRFHPTVESYQRATGLSWFTAGATKGTRIDLLPLPVLQRRGLLDSTLRHELSHALTASALVGEPRWMYEGVAVWVERRGTAAKALPGSDRPASCPADEEFRAARNGAALSRLYDRAVFCYQLEVDAGRSWNRRDHRPGSSS